MAPTVLHIGPRTRPYSAAWARGECWKFVAKLFRPTLVRFWFHFFIKVTAGTGGDPLSCLWNRQCRAHSIGLYNARVGVNSNPTGGFFFLFFSVYSIVVNSSILLFLVWCLMTHNGCVVIVSTSWRDVAQFGSIDGWVCFLPFFTKSLLHCCSLVKS